MARKPLIAGNWKMNLNHFEAIALVQKIAFSLPDKYFDKVDVTVIPPFTDLRSVQTLVDGDKLRLTYGAQDLSQHDSGAYTGEVSPAMLSELDVDGVLLGHSERREYFKETDEDVRRYVDAGELVPDEIVCKVLMKRLDDEGDDGFILDGFPRTVEQARALDAELERVGRTLTAALLVDTPDEEVVRRISGRRQCVKNEQHVYHVEFDPPKHEGVCDQDGSKLIQRDDDHPDTVKHRLEVYREQTEPLADFYEERGLLRRFDGARSTSEVHDHIRATLATLRLESEL